MTRIGALCLAACGIFHGYARSRVGDHPSLNRTMSVVRRALTTSDATCIGVNAIVGRDIYRFPATLSAKTVLLHLQGLRPFTRG